MRYRVGWDFVALVSVLSAVVVALEWRGSTDTTTIMTVLFTGVGALWLKVGQNTQITAETKEELRSVNENIAVTQAEVSDLRNGVLKQAVADAAEESIVPAVTQAIKEAAT